MKLSFESPIEEFVEVALRSDGNDRAFYANVIAVAFGVGGIVGLLGFLYFQNWLASILGFVIGAIYIFASNFNIRERRVRQFYRRHFGMEGPIGIEVDISEAGLSFKQGGETIVRDWSMIERISESDDTVFFHSRNGLVSAVRNRAFVSNVERTEFLDLAKRFIAAGAVPKPPTFNS